MPQTVVFNGVNGATGQYLLDVPADEIVASALGTRLDPIERDRRDARLESAQPSFAPIYGVDTADLSQTGWGVVFPAKGDDRTTRQALAKLLNHRQEQAAAGKQTRFRIFAGADGYRPGDRAYDFLTRHNADPFGPADPDIVPFYLLLAGDADQIPFSFQYELDVQYAVGRLAFGSPGGYETYAESIVAAETGAPTPRTAAFFGVQNPGDAATELSATSLVGPLAEKLGSQHPDWKPGLETVIGARATKASLGSLLARSEPPTFVFTASHGMGFPKDHPAQRTDRVRCSVRTGRARRRGKVRSRASSISPRATSWTARTCAAGWCSTLPATARARPRRTISGT